MYKYYRINSRRLFQIFVLSLLISMITGCIPASNYQKYENRELGISLEKPELWELNYNERNGMIVLTKNGNILINESSRIEIQGPACTHNLNNFTNPREEIEWNIERIRDLYHLESLPMIQEIEEINYEDYKYTSTTIAIPTISLSADSDRNQMGNSSPELMQLIDIIAISKDDNTIINYIYKGKNEIVNNQAKEIINSIKIICSSG